MTHDAPSLHEVPSLAGRRALVTGVTSGLGEHVARRLAAAGAEVVLTGRNPAKLEAARKDLAQRVGGSMLHAVRLDLADLASVRAAAEQTSALGPLSILVNNAGVMATPFARTTDGFELQMGTNHLGHFALTGLLMPSLLASGDARVVTVSSFMARTVRSVPTGDLREHRRYRKWTSYGWSKLANLLFTAELDRRSRDRDLPLTAVAAHPGYAATNLVTSGLNRGGVRPDGAILAAATRLVGQSPEAGAAPVVAAAAAPGLAGGTYLGPSGPFELNGPPAVVAMPPAAYDEELAARLWEASERATGVRFP